MVDAFTDLAANPLNLRLAVAAILPSYVEWLVKALAVVGAAAIGALLVGALVRRLGRWLIFRDVPRPVLLLFRGLGGVAAGLAAWVMVSSPGGSGLFGGGGTVFGGKGTGSDVGKQTPEPAVNEPGTSLPLISRAPAVRIIMLGGARVSGQRFYLIEGQKEPRTVEELKTILKEQQKAGVRNIELVIYENSVARNHPAVKSLEKWAEQNNFTITKLPTKGEMPE
jgi:hypothetical protein